MGVNAAKHFTNQAQFHLTFPIFLITKIFGYDKIMNQAFLSCSEIKSTRNEDGGKEISFKMLLDSGKLGGINAHFLLNVGMQFIPLFLSLCM